MSPEATQAVLQMVHFFTALSCGVLSYIFMYNAGKSNVRDDVLLDNDSNFLMAAITLGLIAAVNFAML